MDTFPLFKKKDTFQERLEALMPGTFPHVSEESPRFVQKTDVKSTAMFACGRGVVRKAPLLAGAARGLGGTHRAVRELRLGFPPDVDGAVIVILIKASTY